MIKEIITPDNIYNISKIILDFDNPSVILLFPQECKKSYIRAFTQAFLISKQAANSSGKYNYDVESDVNYICISSGSITNVIDVLIEMRLFNEAITIKLKKQKQFFINKGTNCFFAVAETVIATDSKGSESETLAAGSESETLAAGSESETLAADSESETLVADNAHVQISLC